MLKLVLELTRHIKCLMSNIVFATGVQKIALGPKKSPQDLEPLVIEDKTCNVPEEISYLTLEEENYL